MNGIEALFFMSFIVVPALCLWNIYLTVRVKTLDAAICRVWNRYVRDQAINQAIDQDPAAVRSAHWKGIGDPYEDFPQPMRTLDAAARAALRDQERANQERGAHD